ncbi:CorA family divalent cation transporter [Aliiruegeria sabulilitoris]|uniref:CorA family divalent cation transporter n=1 Tax=Aliiruegeria sabulilitoris TaxID=1510458 RepID=UPI00082E5750|nr:CorA family divalent cation transporter [Aliiruegeria sabulilitoris]NDR58077.1 magnesium transporter [Pseudoruegeria sp. M32A2M]
MLHAFRLSQNDILALDSPPEGLDEAIWIDLFVPSPAEVETVEALGMAVPAQEDMEELQLSSRLYRIGATKYMTVVLPGLSSDGRRLSRPLCLVLAPERLLTVRYHAPEALAVFPERAARSGAGCGSPLRLCLGLIEEMVDELSDTMEEIGRSLDATSVEVFDGGRLNRSVTLQRALEVTGRFGVRIAAVRQSLLTLARALNYLEQFPTEAEDAKEIKRLVAGQARDVAALEVHADHLASRASVVTDATLGMISLEQNKSVSMLSALVALFAPAMLISSIYGMNFTWMPELDSKWGFALALGGMGVSGIATFLFFKKRGWM